MPEANEDGEDHVAHIAAIREEMRFEIAVFHERINALIGAEAFLLISFTMALVYTGQHARAPFFWVSPILALVGFTLAALAWPGAANSYKIIVEWNLLFVDALTTAHTASKVKWRPSVFAESNRRIHADHRRSMLFSRFAPAIFMIAWVALASLIAMAR